MRNAIGRGYGTSTNPARGRNTLDLLESRSVRLHDPTYFRQKAVEKEIIRFLPGEEAFNPFPITAEIEVYIPSSRIFTVLAVVFDEADGEPEQDGSNYTYNATWGPVFAEVRMKDGNFNPLLNPSSLLVPAAGQPLPDGREVNTGGKRIRGRVTFAGPPDTGGTIRFGAWKLMAMAEPNQHFTGDDDEWDRIANELLVNLGRFEVTNIPPGPGVIEGAIGPGRGDGPAIVRVAPIVPP